MPYLIIENQRKDNMKKYIALIIGFLLIGCGSPDSQSSVKLETAMDSVSYSIGVDIGKNMKAQELDINEKAMFEGWSSSYKGEDLKLTDEDMLSSLNNFRKIFARKISTKGKSSSC